MIQTIAFYVLTTVLTAIFVWTFISPSEIPFDLGQVVTLVGATLLVGSMLLIPWITTDPLDVRNENLVWLESKPNLWQSTQVIMSIREQQLPNASQPFDMETYLCDTSNRQRWWALLERHTQLSAWQLLLKAPTFHLSFTLTLWARWIFAVGILALIGVQHFIGMKDSGHVLRRLLLGLSVLQFLFAVFQIPGADTMGLRQDFKLDYINLLAGVRISGGMWWSLAGLLLIIFGLIAEETDLF
jgi:hypothetical protein